MAQEHDVNISTEAVKAIEGIVDDAYEQMATSAQKVGSQGEEIANAYRGSGTAIAMESYANLGQAGKALSDALDSLKSDLNITGEQGHETNQRAESEMRKAAGNQAYQGMQG